jgi:drug/metabolite transporter (DMT)-like permease
MLIVLAAIWGSSFMFIKVAVEEMAPGEVVFWRVLVGAAALLPSGLALILAGLGLGTGSMRLPRRAPVGGTP